MSQTINVKGMDALARRLKSDLQKLDKRVLLGMRKAAREGRNYMARETIPKAFGDLIASVHAEDSDKGSKIVVDAPYAAAVEVGSRPHTPPLAPLIAWVTVKGIQGLTAGGNVVRSPAIGPAATPEAEERRYKKATRTSAARSVASSLRMHMGAQAAAAWRGHMSRLLAVSANPAGNLGNAEADPAVVAIARGIQRAIAQHGTPPQFYARRSLPAIRGFLAQYVPEQMRRQL